jgi:protein-tyrosine phosphatase
MGVAHSLPANQVPIASPPASLQERAAQERTGQEQTAAGTGLRHFANVDEGIYKGSKPKSDADYEFLQSLHVRYVIDLQVLPLVYRFEKRKAKRYGIELIPMGMNASPFPPAEKHVEKILAFLRDAQNHPVYFHCALGRDRTALVAALYEMYFLGMPPPEALIYLHEAGYKDGWVRSGLIRYLKKHPVPPAGLLSSQQPGSATGAPQ